jgi:hypothetical protein
MGELVHWKPVFLEALRNSPNVKAACRAADIARSLAYREKAADPAFGEAWDDAIADAVDDLEEAAFHRARTESDTLAIFLLKSHRRDVYGEKPAGQGDQLTDAINRLIETAKGDPQPG